MNKKYTKQQLFLIGIIATIVGFVLAVPLWNLLFSTEHIAIAQTSESEPEPQTDQANINTNVIPSPPILINSETYKPPQIQPTSEKDLDSPTESSKLIKKEKPDWDDSDEDIREYDEEEKLSLPRMVRGNLIKQIRSKHNVKLEDILKLDNYEKMHDELLQRLEKHSCKANSEDFIISSEDNLMMFQTKLNQLNYQDLFNAMYEKHLNGNTCKGNAKMTKWSVMDILGPKLTDPETNQKYRLRVLTCHNGSYNNYNNLLDINLMLQAVLHDEHTEALLFLLMWSEMFMGKLKHYEDYEMDPHLIFGIDSKKTIADNLLFTFEGVLRIAGNAQGYEDILIEAMMQGNEIHLVYGKYIPDTQKNILYFVLSFKTYSLTEMKKTCSFLENYRAKTITSIPDDLRPITSPYKSKDDPERRKHKTDRPKHIKLPF